MDDLSVAAGLGAALASGLLIGLERERREGGPDGALMAGARTFPLVALFGGVMQVLASETAGWSLVAGLVVVGGWIAISYVRTSAAGHVGLTSEVALLIAYGCGALGAGERPGLAFAVAIATTALLALKSGLHGVAARLTAADLRAALQFLAVLFVVFPMLPDRTYRVAVPEGLVPAQWIVPGATIDLVNPREVGWMVVLIASIGFVGFVASQLLGPRRGLGLSALLGGLVSSTAVTLSFAGRVREQPGLVETGATAIVVASTTMVARMLVEILVVHPPLLRQAWPVFGAMLLGGCVACLLFWRRSVGGGGDEPVAVTNPFQLSQAAKFGLLYGVVKMVSSAMEQFFGEGGLYLSALVAGTTDVDAITLTVSTMVGRPERGLDPRSALLALLIATLSNSVVKGGLAWGSGSRALGLRVLFSYALMGVLGLMSWLFLTG